MPHLASPRSMDASVPSMSSPSTSTSSTPPSSTTETIHASRLRAEIDAILEETNAYEKYWDTEVASLQRVIRPTEESCQGTVTTYARRKLVDYMKSTTVDAEMLYQFQDDFGDWTCEMWDFLGPNGARCFGYRLREMINFKGVYAGNSLNWKTDLEALQSITDDFPRWPDEFLTTSKSPLHPQTEAYHRRLELRSAQPIRPSDANVVEVMKSDDTKPNSCAQIFMFAAATESDMSTLDDGAPIYGNVSPFNNVSVKNKREFTSASSPYDEEDLSHKEGVHESNESNIPPQWKLSTVDPYSAIPPIEVREIALGSASTIITFNKLWKEEFSYTGKPYDFLGDKVRYFYHTCKIVGIEPPQFHNVFPYILKGPALDYFFQLPINLSFYEVYENFHSRFETGNRYQYLSDWDQMTFQSEQDNNPDKNMREVFDDMVDKFQLCQRALGQPYCIDLVLRHAVTRACLQSRGYENALRHLPLSSKDLAADLRSTFYWFLNRL